MKYSVLALVVAGTAALPEVKSRLRHGTKDDEHRVGGRKPSFGYHDNFPGLVQDVDQSRWAIECLQFWQEVDASPDPYNGGGFGARFSNYNLLQMPSGICMDTLACAFEHCNASYYNGGMADLLENFDVQNGDIQKFAQDYGIKLNLPDQIAFPKSVKDVVEVVEYAKATGTKISVKTSGHSQSGSSTLAKSVNINMRDFPKYSQKPWLNSVMLGELPAVTPCDAKALASIGKELTPACKLALARGKNATLRVGGGELWDDAYRAVDDSNYWMIDNDFGAVEVLGGAAGTVSAAGGWLQGGGLSDGSERVHGYGVDNVLELEMVLPSGQHVKFHPSEWEEAPGYLVPKTKKVAGFCNANVVVDESEWQWEECKVEVSWEDLWYAVRGGGGGSYGVVVALTYQLHPRRFRFHVGLDWTEYANGLCYEPDWPGSVQPLGCKEVQDAFTDFIIDLLYNSSAIGLPEELSLGCGNSGLKYGIFSFDLICHDKEKWSSLITDAWATYWQSYTGPVPAGMDMGKWASSAINFGDEQKSLAIDNLVGAIVGDSIWPVGHLDEYPTPWSTGAIVGWSGLVPVDFFLQKNEVVHSMVLDSDFHVAGGYVGQLDDQMNALSDIYRISGAQHQFADKAEKWFPYVSAFYPTGPGGKILGGTEYNHITVDEFGPLKVDHSAYCPFELTHAEREDLCVSVQENVWGTDGLAKLKDIQDKLDPQKLFQCQKCVRGPI